MVNILGCKKLFERKNIGLYGLRGKDKFIQTVSNSVFAFFANRAVKNIIKFTSTVILLIDGLLFRFNKLFYFNFSFLGTKQWHTFDLKAFKGW